MNAKKAFNISLVVFLLICLTACSSTHSIAKDNTGTLSTNLTISIKNINASNLENKIIQARKQSNKSAEMKNLKTQLELQKKENWQYESKIESEIQTRINDVFEEASSYYNYDFVSSYNSRYIIEGNININYGYISTGSVIDYNVMLTLLDNNNLPIDPKHDSNLIEANSSLPRLNKFNQETETNPITWETNGSIKIDSIEKGMNIIINRISTEIKDSFIANIF